MDTDFRNLVFLGNTMQSYAWFAGIVLAGLLFKNLLSRPISVILYRLGKRFSGEVGIETFVQMIKAPLNAFVMVLILYLAFDRLEFPHEWNLVPAHEFGIRKVIFKLFELLVILTLTWTMLRIVDFIGMVLSVRAAKTETKMDDQLVPFIKDFIKIIIAVFSFFIMLGSVFEVNIAAIIGGIGIAGLALSLAGKETLENLLGSFVIFLDKPFIIGDLVTEGSVTGRIETIGFRSTRIRTLDQTLVSVPNKKMVDAELENLTLRKSTRGKFTVGIRYNTPLSRIRAFIQAIEENLKGNNRIDDNFRVRLFSLSESSIDIEIIFFGMTGEQFEFADIKDQVIYSILEIAEKTEIQFAFPSRSVFVEKK